MKNILLNSLLVICSISSLYLIAIVKAQASDWGCQVILCLSNPGSPTQYGQCRSPVQKLWRELAKGHAFPTCSGVGFRASQPGYEPYYCEAGYKLKSDYGARGREATCVSTSLQQMNDAACANTRNDYSIDRHSILSPHWQRVGGDLKCMGYSTVRPIKRSQPHYVDVTIDGIGAHRVWY